MTRKARLQEYLPEFMIEFREMNALLGTENPEIDALHATQDAMLEDFFIETASAAAIGRYEKIMGIHPAAGDSLKTRKLRLLLAAGRVERFTVARLIETAAKLGEIVEVQLLDGFRIALDYIAADPENVEILQREFRASLPAHLEIITRNVISFGGDAYGGGTMTQSTCYTFEGA